MMKRILYLSFYFEPDLCAGSFRNTPLVKELAQQIKDYAELDLITTLPNRYSTFQPDAKEFEKLDNINVYRIVTPKHKSGMIDQVFSFRRYYSEVNRIVKSQKYDLIVASSSRLFTAYLGYLIAKKQGTPLYLDIRDIFTDTLKDVLKNKYIKAAILPILRQIERKIFNYASHINLISGGFKEYFSVYKKPSYSYYPNGIDDIFINVPDSLGRSSKKIKQITYAGNFGAGQGLHKIIPQIAKVTQDRYKYLLIGDGGEKKALVNELLKLEIENVEIVPPMKRQDLLKVYEDSDFLFLHLNDYDAFKKVLPSKIFELAAYDKPMIAGVAGFANKFISDNISNKILFLPGDVADLKQQLDKYEYRTEKRVDFISKFKRENINQQMANSMVNYIK